MTYIVQDATDGKYEGVRIQFDELPHVGDMFTFRDVEFKIKEIILSKNTLEVISDNYIINLILDEPVEE